MLALVYMVYVLDKVVELLVGAAVGYGLTCLGVTFGSHVCKNENTNTRRKKDKKRDTNLLNAIVHQLIVEVSL